MSIMSDHWIRNQCLPPTHVVEKPHGVIEYASEPFSPNVAAWHRSTELLKNLNSFGMNLTNDPSGVGTDVTQWCPAVRPITEVEKANWKPMIAPFIDGQVRQVDEQKIVSYGLSSYGYDVRLANKFKIFTNIHSGVIDPLNMDDNCYVDFEGDTVIIPPNSYVLGYTVEYFNIPRNVLVVCVGKSTLARAGCTLNVTPIEPMFQGTVVIELANTTTLPMKIHANQGVGQFLFFQSDEPCKTSYADRGGKYQGQTGIVTARV